MIKFLILGKHEKIFKIANKEILRFNNLQEINWQIFQKISYDLL